MEDLKLVVGYLTDDTSLVKSVPLSEFYEWLQWLTVEQLAQFFEELFEMIREMSEGEIDSETLRTFLDDWCEIALEMADPASLLKAMADSLRATIPDTDRTIFTDFEALGEELDSPWINIVGLGQDHRSPMRTNAAELVVRDVTKAERAEHLGYDISKLQLSARARNCLESENITTVQELVAKMEWDLLEYKGLGEMTLNEIKSELADLGLYLGMDMDDEDDEEASF